MKLETANVDYSKGEYTYIISYMTKDRKDHVWIFPSDDCDNAKAEATEIYTALLNNKHVYTASMSIEIATTECR
jgi:hypothetical protein